MGRYEDRIVALARTTTYRCLTAFMTWQPEQVRTDTHAGFDIGHFACWPSFDPSSFMSAFRKQGQQGCIGSCASRTLLIDTGCKWDNVDARDKSGSRVGLATAAKRYRNRPGMSVVGTGRSRGHQWRAETAVSRRSGWQMQICGPGTRRDWNGSHRFLAGGVCRRLAGPRLTCPEADGLRPRLGKARTALPRAPSQAVIAANAGAVSRKDEPA